MVIVIVVRDEVRLWVEAPGSLVVGGVGQLVLLQGVEAGLVGESECEGSAYVGGKVADGL